MEGDVVLLEIVADMQMAIDDRDGAKALMPALGQPRSTPWRKPRNARQQSVVAFQRVVIHQHGRIILRQAASRSAVLATPSRAPIAEVRIRRTVEDRLVGAHHVFFGGPINHIGVGQSSGRNV